MLGVTLSQLLGQDEVSAFLKSVVKGGRFANAYLFHGPAGVGKCTAALAFARAMMCERGAGGGSASPALSAAAGPAAAPLHKRGPGGPGARAGARGAPPAARAPRRACG